MKAHGFWTDDLNVESVIGKQPILGHRQVTDAYLLALAKKRNGVLATLDREILALTGADVYAERIG